MVEANNGRRRVFRIGSRVLSSDDEGSRIQWREFVFDNSGRDGTAGPKPIYIQGHALDQLHERIDLSVPPGRLHYWLDCSCISAGAIRGTGESLKIPYKIDNWKVGYFVIDQLPDLFFIRTFLLLPMIGTPEGNAIADRTGLRKDDINYLNVDCLSKFRTGDIPADPVMRQFFVECGRGDLFEADILGTKCIPPTGQVCEMRRYLDRGEGFRFATPSWRSRIR